MHLCYTRKWASKLQMLRKFGKLSFEVVALVYIKSDDESSPSLNKWGFEFHEPKTDKGRRKISMTLKAYSILKKQLLWKRSIETKGYEAPEGYEDLVFTTTKNTPISPRDTTIVMKILAFQGKFPLFNKTLTFLKQIMQKRDVYSCHQEGHKNKKEK